MDELFKLDPAQVNSAILELLMEIHATDSALLAVLSEIRSQDAGLPLKEVQDKISEYRAMRKTYIRDYIFEHFGKIDPNSLK